MRSLRSLTISPSRLFAALLLVLSLGLSQTVFGVELGESQVKQLNDALAKLRQAQSTYTLTVESANKGSLKGSRLKLALTRLKSAETLIQQANQAIGSLPAEQPNVKAAAEAGTRLAEAAAALRNALTANRTPAPVPTGSNGSSGPASPTAEQQPATKPATPLSSAQRQQLAQVDLILRKADVDLDNIEPFVDQVLQDPNATGQSIQQAGAVIMQTNTKLNEAKAILEQLPLDHPRIAPVASDWQTEAARTQAVAQKLLPRWTAVQEAGGKANYPTYDQDMEMLAGLADAYRDHSIDLQYPDRLAQTLHNDGTAQAALERIAATYKPMIDQQTTEGQAMARQLHGTMGRRQAYLDAAAAHQPQLIARIESLLEEAAAVRTEAVEQQKPLYFAGGVQDAHRRAENWIAVLAASAPDLAAPYTASLQAERAAVAKAQEALRAAIIQANSLPSDAYSGADRQQLIDLAIESWKKEQPEATILTVRIPAQAWNRVTRWSGETTGDAKVRGSKIEVEVEMTKYDNSKIQIQLIVADTDQELAIIRPVNLWKNHQAGDTIVAYNFYALEDELQPHAYLLRTKVP